MSYRAIQSFDHTTSRKGHGHENMSNPNTYPYISQSDNDDSIDKSVEIFSTIHPCPGQRSLSNHSMRPYRMFSSLTRSDRFFVDHSQPPCILHQIQNIPHISQNGMLRNEPK